MDEEFIFLFFFNLDTQLQESSPTFDKVSELRWSSWSFKERSV